MALDFLKAKTDDTGAKIRAMLGGFELPSFSTVATDVLNKTREEDANAAEIADILLLDPQLTIRVLRIVNSAAYAPRQPVENVVQAITLLGFKNLEAIVLSLAVGDAIPKPTCAGYDHRSFWKTACRRGVFARSFAGVMCPAMEAECFSGGYLQDLAIPFLAECRSEEYSPILLQCAADPSADLCEVERERLGFDHAEVGTWIMRRWKLPDKLVAIIGGHHGVEPYASDCPAPVRLSAMLPVREDGDIEALLERLVYDHDIASDLARRTIEESRLVADALVEVIL